MNADEISGTLKTKSPAQGQAFFAFFLLFFFKHHADESTRIE